MVPGHVSKQTRATTIMADPCSGPATKVRKVDKRTLQKKRFEKLHAQRAVAAIPAHLEHTSDTGGSSELTDEEYIPTPLKVKAAAQHCQQQVAGTSSQAAEMLDAGKYHTT